MTARVSVVVVNWNGRRYLERCFQALRAQTFTDFETIMVDNGSEDGSISFVQDHFPQVRLIVNDKNRGFAAANNQAIEATDSEFVVLLNNDTEASPEWLAELVQAAEGDERVGACASLMLFADRPHVVNSAGIALDRAGIAWEWRGGETDGRLGREPVEIFGACAGAALYRRAMLNEVGLFDEDFFAYLEDVDLAWRAQWAGWKTLSVPTARVLHFHSGTAIEGSPFKNRLLGRNKVWLIVKNYPWPQLLFYLPVILAYDLGLLPYIVIWRGNWGPLLGRIEGLAQFVRALRKRHESMGLCRRSRKDILTIMDPVATPRELWRRYQMLRERRRLVDVETAQGIDRARSE